MMRSAARKTVPENFDPGAKAARYGRTDGFGHGEVDIVEAERKRVGKAR